MLKNYLIHKWPIKINFPIVQLKKIQALFQINIILEICTQAAPNQSGIKETVLHLMP